MAPTSWSSCGVRFRGLRDSPPGLRTEFENLRAMGREKAQAVKPARPNIQPEENRPRPLDDLKAIDRKLRFCVQSSFRLTLFRFQITLDAPDLTLPARS